LETLENEEGKYEQDVKAVKSYISQAEILSRQELIGVSTEKCHGLSERFQVRH